MAAVSGGGCGFVLVAGGLGERLGYSGIKVQLPSQLTTGTTYLELYIRHILALQGSGAPLPLAIMTSGDTDAQTRALLDANANFGMRAGQVTIVRQEKVACLADNDARLAADPKDPYKLLTKPHGHGDVHYLLHSSGTLDAWLESGVQWVYFMQDTNAPSLKVLPAAIGISRRNQLDVNSVCVPRMPGESIGGLMALTHADGRTQTANVEYNQIDALLKATVEPRGDVADPATGRSPYPGSINQLLFALGPYTAQLHKTGGTMPEFVNPKYADASKTKFKSPTRLECMMQDYPKSLPPSARVGFSVISNTTAFSPVKTNLADARAKSAKGEPTYSAASGEADVYASACEVLAASGVRLPPPVHAIRDGVGVVDTPRVVIDPSFGPTLAAVRDKLPTPHAVSLAQGSTLVLEGDLTRVRLEALSLDGALVVRVVPGADVTIRNLRVSNKGWEFGGLTGGEPEELARSRQISHPLRRRRADGRRAGGARHPRVQAAQAADARAHL